MIFLVDGFQWLPLYLQIFLLGLPRHALTVTFSFIIHILPSAFLLFFSLSYASCAACFTPFIPVTVLPRTLRSHCALPFLKSVIFFSLYNKRCLV